MSNLSQNVTNEFIEFIGTFAIKIENALNRNPPFITRGPQYAMYVQLVRDVFDASFDRRAKEDYVGLLEDGVKRMIYTSGETYKREGGKYIDSYQKEMVLHRIVAMVESEPYPFMRVVDFELWGRRKAVLPESYYRKPWAEDFGNDGYSEEHPMCSFTRFLDYMDDIKGVDQNEYKANLKSKRVVESLRRVGLCFVPQENWQPRFHLPKALSQLADRIK